MGSHTHGSPNLKIIGHMHLFNEQQKLDEIHTPNVVNYLTSEILDKVKLDQRMTSIRNPLHHNLPLHMNQIQHRS